MLAAPIGRQINDAGRGYPRAGRFADRRGDAYVSDTASDFAKAPDLAERNMQSAESLESFISSTLYGAIRVSLVVESSSALFPRSL
ncbi:hypothetical protein EVAR_47260_1 [Eumeta japonica]|uniref:Uncharacterized protein n=1 Tax=Eumeta variegata TaxID=151549 RepID=A0A4C1XJJ8_EUMVA|nr:hypothetical protein EVAR_47260_1 [Eumeta japonica]